MGAYLYIYPSLLTVAELLDVQPYTPLCVPLETANYLPRDRAAHLTCLRGDLAAHAQGVHHF